MAKKKKDVLVAFNETLKEFNQIEYINEYNRKNYKNYHIKIRNDKEKLIEHIEKQENKNAYFISLIEKDMNK